MLTEPDGNPVSLTNWKTLWLSDLCSMQQLCGSLPMVASTLSFGLRSAAFCIASDESQELQALKLSHSSGHYPPLFCATSEKFVLRRLLAGTGRFSKAEKERPGLQAVWCCQRRGLLFVLVFMGIVLSGVSALWDPHLAVLVLGS